MARLFFRKMVLIINASWITLAIVRQTSKICMRFFEWSSTLDYVQFLMRENSYASFTCFKLCWVVMTSICLCVDWESQIVFPWSGAVQVWIIWSFRSQTGRRWQEGNVWFMCVGVILRKLVCLGDWYGICSKNESATRLHYHSLFSEIMTTLLWVIINSGMRSIMTDLCLEVRGKYCNA